MNTLMEEETKLESANIGDGFYNIIGGQRLAAIRELSVVNPATGKELATVPDQSHPIGMLIKPEKKVVGMAL
jgi:hypothetical protein